MEKIGWIALVFVLQIALLGFMYHLFGTESIDWEENSGLIWDPFTGGDNATVDSENFKLLQKENRKLKRKIDKQEEERQRLFDGARETSSKVRDLEDELDRVKHRSMGDSIPVGDSQGDSGRLNELGQEELRKLKMKAEYTNERFFKELKIDLENLKKSENLRDIDVIHQKVKRAEDGLSSIESNDIVLQRNGAFGLPTNRLMCVVPGRYPEYKHNMETILKTWGQHCSQIIFTVISDKPEDIPKKITVDSFEGSYTPKKKLEAPIVVFSDTFRPEDGENLIEKMFRSLDWVYKNIDPLPDYTIKVDTDYFLIPENLEILLSQHDPDKDAVMFGNWLYHRPEITWRFPGGVYTLSRAALKKFAELIQDALVTKHSGSTRFVRRGPCIDWPLHDDDLYIGMCCDQLNITMAYSKDKLGREMFCPLGFEQCIGMRQSSSFWYTKNKDPDTFKNGIDHYSAHPAAFHRVKQAGDMAKYYKHLYIMSVKQGGPFGR